MALKVVLCLVFVRYLAMCCSTVAVYSSRLFFKMLVFWAADSVSLVWKGIALRVGSCGRGAVDVGVMVLAWKYF